MACERLRIADVHQTLEELQRVVELHARIEAALDAEGENAGGATLHIFLRECVMRMILQSGIAHPLDGLVRLQVLGDALSVLAMTLHAQRQGFHALQKLEGVEGRQCRTRIAQRHGARTTDVSRRSERIHVHDAVVRSFRFAEHRIAILVRGPRKLSRVHDQAAERRAVTADVLGGRVHDDVDAVLEGLQQHGRGNGVVYDRCDAMASRHLRDLGDIHDIAGRITDRFEKHCTCFLVDELFEVGGLVARCKSHLDAELRQHVSEQRVRATVELRGRHDVVSGLGQIHDRIVDRGTARRNRQCAHAAFE